MKKQGEEVAISVHNYLAPTYTPNISVGHVDKYNIDLVQYCNNALNEAIHVRRSQFLFVSSTNHSHMCTMHVVFTNSKRLRTHRKETIMSNKVINTGSVFNRQNDTSSFCQPIRNNDQAKFFENLCSLTRPYFKLRFSPKIKPRQIFKMVGRLRGGK